MGNEAVLDPADQHTHQLNNTCDLHGCLVMVHNNHQLAPAWNIDPESRAKSLKFEVICYTAVDNQIPQLNKAVKNNFFFWRVVWRMDKNKSYLVSSEWKWSALFLLLKSVIIFPPYTTTITISNKSVITWAQGWEWEGVMAVTACEQRSRRWPMTILLFPGPYTLN